MVKHDQHSMLTLCGVATFGDDMSPPAAFGRTGERGDIYGLSQRTCVDDVNPKLRCDDLPGLSTPDGGDNGGYHKIEVR